MTTDEIVKLLRAENKRVGTALLRVYADALRVYNEAADNVAKNGAICTHPRTGQPIENPYLKVQAAQGKVLREMRYMVSDKTIAALEKAAQS